MKILLRTGLVLALAALIAGCGDDSSSSTASTATTSAGGDDARQYCKDSGGQAEVAHPYFGTNNSRPKWIALARSTELCRFESGAAGAPDSTRIYVDLDTLYSTEPTLAGVAYLSKVPPQTGKVPSANPATVNCAALDGSSQFGLAGSSGGWVTDDRPDEVFNLCVFPDLSFIDEFGIFYCAGGVVRGQDLSKVMRYHPAVLPNFFPH